MALQPMQPMGTPNMAATGPQAPKPQQQQIPAGAMMGIMPSGGIMEPIDKIARANHGNPAALEQKGLSGDLLAALAAQRLKTLMLKSKQQIEAEAAGQTQQDKPYNKQLEDELMEMTKQDLQQQGAETLQQKQVQQQQGQQRLMQAAMNPQAGIAGIPAPNAAEPKAMAAGGIIAFDGGGSTTIDPVTGEPYTEEPRTGIADWFRGTSAAARGFSPEVVEAIKINPDVQAYVEKYGTQLLSSPDLQQFQRDPRGYVQSKQAEAARPVNQAQAQAVPDTQAQPTPEKKPEGQNVADIRRPAPIRNIAAVPGGGIAGGGRNDVLERVMTESMQQDPRKVAEASRESAYKFLQPSEEDMTARREGLASLKALNAAENDPDRQWVRRVLRTLPSRGTSFMANTMGDVGAGALAARDEEYARQLQGIGNEQRMLKGIMEDVYKPKKEASDVGSRTEQFASSEKTHGMTAASHIRSSEIQAAVQAASHQAAALERQLTRETNDRYHWGSLYKDALGNLETALGKNDTLYANRMKAFPVTDKPTADQQRQMLEAERDHKMARTALLERYTPIIQQAAKKADIGSGIANLATDAAGTNTTGYRIVGSQPTK